MIKCALRTCDKIKKIYNIPQKWSISFNDIWLQIRSLRATQEKCKKRSFIVTVRPTVHTNPGHENRDFRRRSSNQRNLKTPALNFSVNRKDFENGAMWIRWRHDNHVISLTEFSSNTNANWRALAAFLNSSSVMWTETSWLENTYESLPRADWSTMIPVIQLDDLSLSGTSQRNAPIIYAFTLNQATRFTTENIMCRS